MFDVWTKNLADFFLVYLVLAIISTLLGVLIVFAAFGTFEPGGGIIPGSPPAGVPTVDVGALLLYAAAAVVASVILNSIVTGGMTEYAVRRYRGESMTVGQALRRGIQRFLSILGATILLTLLLFGFILLPLLFLLTLAGAASSGSAGGVIAVICGLVIALIVGGILVIFVLVSMSLYAPAIMMENASAIEGLSRSWNLTKGHRLSIFGAVLVAGLLIFVISAVITLPASFVRNPIASIVASALASAIVGPWFAILVAVAYDLIVRPFGSMPSYVPGPTPPPVP